MNRRSIAVSIAVASWLALAPALMAWGPQGHRLVALVAANRLTPAARAAVASLLDGRSLADVAVWADQYNEGVYQTSFWHYTNIPAEATSYDRDRDCPRQPGVAAGSRNDKWRDCVVDRILYNQERLANTALDRPDRAVALKFLVHFVGDLHQPFHALGVERGGNGIAVSSFGSPTCVYDAGSSPFPCNLHSVWDTMLIAHRRRSDDVYLAALEALIKDGRLESGELGTPETWAIASHDLAKAALVAPKADTDEAYFTAQIGVVERQLALGGIRLAALINQALGSGK